LRILITGAAGFLGSHLCDRFRREGHSVVAIDNYITGTPENLAHLLGDGFDPPTAPRPLQEKKVEGCRPRTS